MTLIEGIVLGVFQGLTEFLPISSSGHLVIIKSILKVEEPGSLYEIALHLGTLFSIIIVFYEDVKNLVKSTVNILAGFLKIKSLKIDTYEYLIIMILVGSIPTAVIGFTFQDFIEKLFNSPSFVGFMLIITGFFLLLSDKIPKKNKFFSDMKVADAVFIGFFQGLAVTPGISRSGATIFAGLLRGLSHQNAVRYSFLLSLPAVLGAALLKSKDVLDIGINNISVTPLIAGVITSAVSGIVAIKFLVNILNRGKLYYFSVYCWILALLVILFA